MAMTTFRVTNTNLALRPSLVPDAWNAEATARDASGTTAASRQTELPPGLPEAVEKSRYRIRQSAN